MNIEEEINVIFENIKSLSYIESDRILKIFHYLTSVEFQFLDTKSVTLEKGLKIIRNSIYFKGIATEHTNLWLIFLKKNLSSSWTPYRIYFLQILHNLVSKINCTDDNEINGLIEDILKNISRNYCGTEIDVAFLLIFTLLLKNKSAQFLKCLLTLNNFSFLIEKSVEINNGVLLLQHLVGNYDYIFDKLFNDLNYNCKEILLNCIQHSETISPGIFNFMSCHFVMKVKQFDAFIAKCISYEEFLIWRQFVNILSDSNTSMKYLSEDNLKEQIITVIKLLRQLREMSLDPEELAIYKSCHKPSNEDIKNRPIFNLRCELFRLLTGSISFTSENMLEYQELAVDHGAVDQAVVSMHIDVCNPHIELTSALLIRALCNNCEKAQNRINEIDQIDKIDDTFLRKLGAKIDRNQKGCIVVDTE